MKLTHKSENDVKADVAELLKRNGWFQWPNAAGPYSVHGISDRTALKDGVFLAIECKYNGNEPTNPQKKFLREVIAHGGVGMVIDETEIRELTLWLAAFNMSGLDAVHRWRDGWLKPDLT